MQSALRKARRVDFVAVLREDRRRAARARHIGMPGDGGGVERRKVLSGGAALAVAVALPVAGSAVADPSCPRSDFATDIRLPGLLHAVVARPPLPGRRLDAVDGAAALRLRHVVDVIRLEPSQEPGLEGLGGVAVLASDTWSALRGRDLLRPVWLEGTSPARDRPTPFFVPATAEAPFERPSATVELSGGRCTVWSCLEATEPFRQHLARSLGLAPTAVTVHATRSAVRRYRFSNATYALEAALLSRAMSGVPVSLTWTAEDDLPFQASTAVA